MSYAPSILGNLAKTKGWNVTLKHYSHLDTESKIEEIISQDKPNIIALSFLLFGRNLAFKIAKIAKKLKIKVIGGGVHPSSCPEDVVNSGLFDAIVIGDGMGVLEKILDDYSSLDKTIIDGKMHHDISLYTKRYFSDELIERMKQSRTIELLSSIGCPYNCYFCASNKNYRKIPNKMLINSIINAKQNYDIERLFVFDDMFVTNINNIRDFRTQLEQTGFKFSYQQINLRSNVFDENIAQELKLLGVEDLAFGVETISERLLKFLNKKITVADIYKSLDISKKHNFSYNIYLMVGLPTQTESEYEMTLKFINEVSPDRVIVSVFIPYPKTKLFNYCLNNGYFIKSIDYSRYLGINPYSSEFSKNLIKPELSKINYEMAHYYKKAYEQIIQDKHELFIKTTLTKVDKNKWVLFGTDDYFYYILRKINEFSLINCIGYYDYDFQNGHKGRIYDFPNRIPLIDMNKAKPDTIVVTVHKQGILYKNLICSLLRKNYQFQGDIVSVSTFHNH